MKEGLNGILLHNIICRDSGEQCIKVNPNWTEQTGFTDDSTLQCSTIELTSAGRSNVRGDCYTGGIDAHGAWGWTVANNLFEGWWCATGSPAEHAIHFWSSSRDTIVEGNIVLDNARGIGLGLSDSGFERTYTPDPYPSAYMGHADGVIRNNFVACADSGLHASEAGCDTGIGVESGPGVDVYNNTVMATGGSVGLAIDYRYPDTDVVSVNNATDGSISTRNSATISVDLTNLESMSDAYVTSISTGDLHLAAGASNAIDQGTAGYATTDFDGDPRDDGSIDIGADEYDSSPAPTPVEQGQKEDGASTSGVKKE